MVFAKQYSKGWLDFGKDLNGFGDKKKESKLNADCMGISKK
jgi:hypothetical protein